MARGDERNVAPLKKEYSSTLHTSSHRHPAILSFQLLFILVPNEICMPVLGTHGNSWNVVERSFTQQ
ncbi:lanthionine synthetase c family protein [Moniliophthora roreri]|nr:lanthionine synthetase c family protein [Moniliophthora roreri]